MTVLAFVGGTIFGACLSILMAVYLQKRWAKMVKESREEVDRVLEAVQRLFERDGGD